MIPKELERNEQIALDAFVAATRTRNEEIDAERDQEGANVDVSEIVERHRVKIDALWQEFRTLEAALVPYRYALQATWSAEVAPLGFEEFWGIRDESSKDLYRVGVSFGGFGRPATIAIWRPGLAAPLFAASFDFGVWTPAERKRIVELHLSQHLGAAITVNF
ncbi:MAG: hypothetical protein EPO40_17710 [Myxococcaceae bacterium]|nr:MAG: hypothetical protein EPO40_17710 [Myxococcaceae bacterium]